MRPGNSRALISKSFAAAQLLLLSLILFGTAGRAAAQGNTDLIRGRITGMGDVALAGVRVHVVSLSTQMTRVATSDSTGRYTVVFPSGGGNYIASFNHIGFYPVVRQVKRLNDEDLLVADITMRESPVVLTNVIVLGRGLPLRGSGDLADSTGSWALINGAGLSLGDMGHLLLMAAQLPGVALATDADGNPVGISILGLGPDQNRITVDGVEQDVRFLPTEDMPTARLTTTTSDPSKGGFSGAAVAVVSKPGTWQVTRSLGLTLDEPNLQFSDNVGDQVGREYTNLQLSGESSGPVVKDRLFYKSSFAVGRRLSDRYTMLNTGHVALAAVGASPDSVARLLGVMQQLGIPATAQGIPRSQLVDNASVMLRGDFTPQGTHALNATLNASWRNQASSTSPLTAPARGGDTEALNAAAQLNHSSYFPLGLLSESKVAFAIDRSGSDAYLALPDARVRVRSEKADGTNALATFQLGGNSSMPVTTRDSRWEFSNFLSWASKDNAHRVKFGTELKWSQFFETKSTNRHGTFTFNSLEDFEAGEPSDFRRQLTETEGRADLFTTAFSLGDQWRKSKTLNIQYGVRVELDRYGERPRHNPAVDSVFGVRNDYAPNDVHVIPRLGFTWNYGTAPQIAAFEGAARGPAATLRGTIGEYRNTPSRSLLQSAMGMTGLPDGVQLLGCSGDAAPQPDWPSYAIDATNIPDHCADGTGASVFADRQPGILLFGPEYEPQKSWRADLGWSGTALRRYKLAVTGIYSFNRAQTGKVDLNFSNRVRFSLPFEGNRPVYISPSSISSSSGSVGTRETKVTQLFSRVTEQRSDLQSMSGQLNVAFSPVVVSPRGIRWSLNYVHLRVSEFRRGFGGTTASGPLPRSWSPGKDANHQVNLALDYKLLGFNVGLAARVTSGVHYTPMIRGDINGDGEQNDRAYVFDPARTADSALAVGMRALLAGAPGGARRCLARQLGSIAGANSCSGPWSTTMNLSLSLDARKFALPGQTTLSMSFGNPMTGLDLLLRGKAEERAWGQQYNNPDATLLYVRGFDHNTRQFRYEVNPDFGGSKAARATQGKPFLVTLRFSMNVSPALERQRLRRDVESWQAPNARRPTETALKRQYTQPFTSIFESILRQRDTLRLSAAQADSISGLTAVYSARIDSLWAPLAAFMSGIQGKDGLDDAYRRTQQLRRASYDLMAVQSSAVRHILTVEQFNRLPQSYGPYFDAKQLARMR